MDPLLDDAPCGFLRLADDGTILAANTTLRNLLGREPDTLAGSTVETVLSTGARIFYQTHVFPLLRLHGRAEEIYLTLRAEDGTDVPVLLNAVRREHAGAAASDWVVVPMRRRNQFEQELIQARKVAESASQAKGRFLSMMSHDLRTPLSAITMTAELVARGGRGPVTDAQRGDLERIQHASQYVLELVGQILDYARLEAGHAGAALQTVAVEEVLARVEALGGHLLEQKEISYMREGDANAPTVWADPDRLLQVVLNLLTNAAKFTERGGRVAIDVAREGEEVHLHVRDTGRGIPPGQIERIFDPFVQVDQAASGTGAAGVGLGLAISRELTRAMGGDLKVESTLGRGATFTVVLPASTPDSD